MQTEHDDASNCDLKGETLGVTYNKRGREVTNDGAAGRSRFKTVLFSLIALILGTSLCLVLAEFAIRLLNPQSLISDILETGTDVDYRLRPNAIGRMVSQEWSVKIKVNSLGFRGEEISLAKKPGLHRVLFLGDSYVFGHGLGEEETLPFLVGQELDRIQPDSFEVINGGVYGYSTANELEFFMKYGLPVKPDIIVILVMLHDMIDNPNWYELSNDGRLKRKKRSSSYVESRRITKYIPGSSWLRGQSHLFKFIGMRILPVVKSGFRSTKETKQGKKAVVSSPEFNQDETEPYRVTVALLTKLVKVAKENGAKSIGLVGGPRSSDMHTQERLILGMLDAGFSEAFALPPILATYKGDENLSFPLDRHWTSVATRFVAPKIAGVIALISAQSLQH